MNQYKIIWLMNIIIVSTLISCARIPERVLDPRDPLESYNRAVDHFNRDFDRAFLQPIAKGYRKITPEPVNRGITNFFNNLSDIDSCVNNFLQFKMVRASGDVGRILMNSTVGVLGFFDVASTLGLPRYTEDFGQTLGYWGVGSGPYIVLPLFGPSTLRDNFGLFGDLAADPLLYLKVSNAAWGLGGLRLVDERADLLAAGQILEESALDPYRFMRDAYLQRRLNLIYDGNPPVKQNHEDFWDELDSNHQDKNIEKTVPANQR